MGGRFRLFVLALISIALSTGARCEGPTGSDTGAPNPCGSDPRCLVLSDADADGDYADDLQRALNTLAYANYATAAVSNERVEGNDEGFFGIHVDGDPNTLDRFDRLNQTPIAIQTGGTCRSGLQSATISSDGALTGDVSTSPVAVSSQAMNCGADGDDGNCISKEGFDDHLHGPVEITSVVCSRSGATDVVFTGSDRCTGSAHACAVGRSGALTIHWNAGTGDTTCSYDRRATNTVTYRTNGKANGRIDGRWASKPTGATTCSYTAVTSPDAGLDPQEARILPPPGVGRVPFQSRVSYCRNWNSETPTGDTVPACTSPTDRDGIPRLVFDEAWDGVEIACEPPLAGPGQVTWCFRMNAEALHGVNAGDRPGVLFRGAPIIDQLQAEVVPGASGDFSYGFWFDGVDDSHVWVRPKNSGGDPDHLAVVLVGDNTLLRLGSWAPWATEQFGNVYIDGVQQSHGAVTIQGDPPGTTVKHVEKLEIGSVFPGYKDPAIGYQALSINNGCAYSGDSTIRTCDGVLVNGLSMGSMRTPGVPRDFHVIGAVTSGDIEFIVNQDDAGNVSPFIGPTRVDCAACGGVRLHALSAYGRDVLLQAHAFVVSGLVDRIQNDAIAIDPEVSATSYRNFTTVLLDGVVSRSNPPYATRPVHRMFDGPGLVDYLGSPDYVWTVQDDFAGTLGSSECARAGSEYAPLQACDLYSSVHENVYRDSFLGGVRIRLLEDVPSARTECDLQVEIAGGCTACDTSVGEPAGGKVFKYGGTDRWGRPLRRAGDWTQWSLLDAVSAGQDVTVELRPVAGGTACAAGSGCACDGVNALEISVDALPALHDASQPAR